MKPVVPKSAPHTSIGLDDGTRQRLEPLAESTQRSTSFLATKAIHDDSETSAWQTAAIAEAAQSDFATDQEVAHLTRAWGVRSG